MHAALTLFVFSMMTLTAHAGLSCKSLINKNKTELSASVHKTVYPNAVRSSPVRTQCMSTCGLHSRIAQIENISGETYEIDYNIVTEVIKRGRERLNSKIDAQVDLFDPPFTAASAAQSVVHFGLIKSGELKISSQGDLRQAVVLIKTFFPEATLSEVESNFVVYAAAAVELLLSNKNRLSLETAADFLNLLEKMYEPNTISAQQNLKKVLGTRPVLEMVYLDKSSLSIMSTFNKIHLSYSSTQINLSDSSNLHFQTKLLKPEKLIKWLMEKIDNRKSVAFTFAHVTGQIDQNSGVVSSPAAASPYQPALWDKRIGHNALFDRYSGHGNTIEGYRIDDSGAVIFLVKDSQGPAEYDAGYLHMPASFIIQTISSLSILSPSF